MESFGSDLLQYNSASFNLMGELKKHFDEDLVFYNFLPGSGGTAESVEVILANMPKRPYSPVLSQSKNAYKKYNFGAAVPYQNNKYETAFIYGGGIGWRKMGAFSLNLGFDKAIGAGSMDDKYPRNQWGVYDEHLLDYAFNYLRSSKNKKFIAVLTTTNHPPYSLPKDYKHMPLKIPQELDKKISNKDLARKRFEVYQYANDSVGKFISRIKNSEFAQNTIIAITGDHNFWGLYEYEESQLFNSYKVPFYLYIPKKLKPV
jgi:phosphoglycerol transferase MdoB-like AlkP superfamily enzyme